MAQDFGTGANVMAYLGVAATTSQASYNFLRNYVNAPSEVQAFLDEYDTAQAALDAFYATLSKVRSEGLFFGHDTSMALNLGRTTVDDVNLFVKGFCKHGDPHLSTWKQVEVAIRENELAKYSSRLRNMTTHIIAVQQSIICAFLSKHSGQIGELQANTTTADNISSLTTEVLNIRQVIGDLKIQLATQERIDAPANVFVELLREIESKITSTSHPDLLIERLSEVNESIASLRDEVAGDSNNIAMKARQIRALGQAPQSASVGSLDHLQNLETAIKTLTTSTLDHFSTIQEILYSVVRQLTEQERRLQIICNTKYRTEEVNHPDGVRAVDISDGNNKYSVEDITSAKECCCSKDLETPVKSVRTLENQVKNRHESTIPTISSISTESLQLLSRQPDSDSKLSPGKSNNQKPSQDLVDPSHALKVSPSGLFSQSRNTSDDSLSSRCTIESVFSTASLTSLSTMSSIHEDTDPEEQLVHLLIPDLELKSVVRQVLQNSDTDRFERNVCRLLKRFAVNLQEESSEQPHMFVARLVRVRAHDITKLISNLCLPADLPNLSLNSKYLRIPRRKSSIDVRLGALHPTMITFDHAYDSVSSDEESDMDDDEDLDLTAFSDVGRFIAGSGALKVFQNNLRGLFSSKIQSRLEKEIPDTDDTDQLHMAPRRRTRLTHTGETSSTCLSSGESICEADKSEDEIASSSARLNNNLTIPSQNAKDDLCCEKHMLPSEVITINEGYVFRTISGYLHTAVGFLLPAVVGIVFGYYMSSRRRR